MLLLPPACLFLALVDVHWCMEHIHELVISYCEAHSSNLVCQSQGHSLALRLFVYPSSCLPPFRILSASRIHSLTHTCFIPAPQWVAGLYKYWNSGTAKVPAESTFHFAMPSSPNNCAPFFFFLFFLCRGECAAGSPNCLWNSSFIPSENYTIFSKKNNNALHRGHHKHACATLIHCFAAA